MQKLIAPRQVLKKQNIRLRDGLSLELSTLFSVLFFIDCKGYDCQPGERGPGFLPRVPPK